MKAIHQTETMAYYDSHPGARRSWLKFTFTFIFILENVNKDTSNWLAEWSITNG